MFSSEFCEIDKNTFFTEHLGATAFKQVTVPLQCLQTTKSLIQPILGKKICDIYKFQIFKKITIFHNILNVWTWVGSLSRV